MQKLGVLFFADRLPPLIGGMEIHARYFIEHFIHHIRFPILSVVTKDHKGKDCYLLGKEKKYIHFNKLPYLFNPSFLFFNSGRWIEELEQLRNIFPNAKFIYRTGGNEILQASLDKHKQLSHELRRSYWVNVLNRTVDLLITNSNYTETRLNEIGIKCPFQRFVGGVNISELSVLNEIKTSDFKLFTIFCAARFVPYKNHALMIDLVRELILRKYNVNLRLAGDGPLLGQIKKQVAKYNLTKVIKFGGGTNI